MNSDLSVLTFDPGRFWHITDLHLDPSYRMSPDPTAVCASSKGAPASDPGPFGDYLCDAPFRLIRSALSHVRPLVLPQDFVIWTGSVPNILSGTFGYNCSLFKSSTMLL